MRALSVGLLAFVVGCGPGALDGELLGAPVAVQSVIFGVATHTASGHNIVSLMLSEDPELCEKLGNKVGFRSSVNAIAFMVRASDDGKTLLPFLDGEYQVESGGKGRLAGGTFQRTGSDCGAQLTSSQGAFKKGSIGVRGYSSSARQFGVDVNLIVGVQEDWLRGSLTATHCDALSALTVDVFNGKPVTGTTCD